MTPRPFPHINRRLGATPLITLVSFLSAGSCLFFFSQVARHSREQRPNECNNKVILVFHLFTDGAGVASRRSASPNLFPSSDYANGISALLAAAARSPAPLDEAPALRISVTDRRNRSENPSAHRTRHTTGFRTCHPLLSRFTSKKKRFFRLNQFRPDDSTSSSGRDFFPVSLPASALPADHQLIRLR